ncbi:MAG TPA: sugar phosphate isomerase/epimerase family protein [Pirellulales bacterium]|jgi:sugar phosphate isomerase/epimerase|nr:sugar phosphate isomerase/epimerase family protein [Pirellulales bacterium]
MFKNLSTEGIGVSGRQSEIIELALSFGFKGIDLDLIDFQQQVKAHGLPHSRRLLDSARLKVGAFRLPLVWDDSDETYQQGVRELPELLQLAADLGAKRAVTTLAPANDTRPYHENFEFHRRRLAEIGGLLAPAGMRLGIEFVAPAAARKNRAFQFIHTFDAIVTLVNMIRAPNVGAVVDPWQIHAAGSSLDDIRKLSADRIVAAYLSDAPAVADSAALTEADRLLPGETGKIDCAALLTMLAELGFDGPISPRAHRDRLAGMRREQIVKLAGERVDQAWKSAGLSPAGKLVAAKR